jgi:hypothetical protein
MNVAQFTFTVEIPEFKIDDYIPYMGWIASKPSPIKVYRSDASQNYFLHDETLDKLYEFIYHSEAQLQQKWEFENAIEAYYVRYPENRN